jgi:hypothetical protein
MMKIQLLKVTVVLFILSFSVVAVCASTFFVSGLEPSKLKIYVGPTSVLADNSAYNIIVVQLQDSAGKPARAQEDTLISLSSSLTNIGSVNSTINILKGATFAKATFRSTFSPGTTTITATASGYATVQAKVATVGPVPSTLAVYAFPPVLPADGKSYPAVIVQLQDSGGSPARAPLEGLPVTLSCSNTAVGSVEQSVVIRGGETFAVANFTTVQLLLNQTGTANVIAVASGYSSKQTAIATQGMSVGGDDLMLKVFVGPPKIMAEGIAYERVVAVQLQNSSGRIVQAPGNVSVTLSSSSTEVGLVQPTLSISQFSNYALAKFDSTFTSGTTNIVAVATNYESSQQSLTTIGPVPSKISVYAVPSTLPSDSQKYDAIQVQLQDSRGNPAKDPTGDITVYLSSSEPDAGNVSSTLTIPFSKTYATGTFFSTCSANSATITAQTSGYESGQAKITTYLIDTFTLDMNVTSEFDAIRTGEETTIRAYIAYNGTTPATKVAVKFTSNKGGNFSISKEEGDGFYSTVFTAPKAANNTVCTITANATRIGYNSTVAKLQITINPSSMRTGTVQLQVTEDNSNPIGQATVTVFSEVGDETFNGVTNDTGYITIPNILEGNYIVQTVKEGFDSRNETISFLSDRTVQRTVFLARSAGFPWLLIIVVVIVVVVCVVGGVFLIKRRRSGPEERGLSSYVSPT